MNIIEELTWRDLIYQQTDESKLLKNVEAGKITIYVGFDPTADSLHIGHLVPYITLQRFLQQGHRVIIVVGGATGSIGDPSGRSEERNLLAPEEIKYNTRAIQKQIQRLLKSDDVTFVNNDEWLSKITMIEMFRDYGKLFNMNTMLSKENVQTRLENGLSFTEFSYPILQSIDFYELNKRYGCTVQLGGSDQWGNIISGVELIRKITDGKVETFGITSPLITKSDGTKFGKSAGGAIWLSAEKTSPYELYQFWLNVSDADVVKYLKTFTFLTSKEIDQIKISIETEPQLRKGQKYLASYITKLVHGEESLNQVQLITAALFSGDIAKLSARELEDALKDGPCFDLTEDGLLLDVLVEFKVIDSKRQGREFIANSALKVNGKTVENDQVMITKDNAIDQRLTVIRKGKKTYVLIKHN
ncbi:MAG: tyrosine--tRNA ligase [Culicoidibacterales bacterium]